MELLYGPPLRTGPEGRHNRLVGVTTVDHRAQIKGRKNRMVAVEVFQVEKISRSCYTGEQLREIRKQRGCGRPPAVTLKRQRIAAAKAELSAVLDKALLHPDSLVEFVRVLQANEHLVKVMETA